MASSPWVAVEPVGDRVAHARSLRRLHEQHLAGEDVHGAVRAIVAQSWERSGAAGIDPDRHRAPIVLDEEAISDRWHRHPLFPVLPVLRDLLSDATTQSGHMLVISDAEGVLLWIEGHRRVIEATEDMHLVTGADWSEQGAGTNALGTAIAVDHPVQIFSAEHFNRVVHPWQCSGAPIHDPATGETIGVIDLTGHLRTAHPHTLSLVAAAAGMAEAFMRQDLLRRREALRERFRDRVEGRRHAAALVDATGAVLDARPRGWLRRAVAVPPGGGEVRLPDGTAGTAEPLADGAHVLWRRAPARRRATAPALRLELLTAAPRAVLDGTPVPLTLRHAEVLALLALAPAGRTAEELAAELWGRTGRAVSARAELSRLRRLLGEVVLTRPYRLAPGCSSDLADLRQALARGEAVAGPQAPLLPRSRVPAVVAAREALAAAHPD